MSRVSIPISADATGAVAALRSIEEALRRAGEAGKRLADVDFSKPELRDLGDDLRRVQAQFVQLQRVERGATAMGVRSFSPPAGHDRIDALGWFQAAQTTRVGSPQERARHIENVGRFILQGTRFEPPPPVAPTPGGTAPAASAPGAGAQGQDQQRSAGTPPARPAPAPPPGVAPVPHAPPLPAPPPDIEPVAAPAPAAPAVPSTQNPRPSVLPATGGFVARSPSPPPDLTAPPPQPSTPPRPTPAAAQAPQAPPRLAPAPAAVPPLPEADALFGRETQTRSAAAARALVEALRRIEEAAKASGQGGRKLGDLDVTKGALKPLADDIRKVFANFNDLIHLGEGRAATQLKKWDASAGPGGLDPFDWLREAQTRFPNKAERARHMADVAAGTLRGTQFAPQAAAPAQAASAAPSLIQRIDALLARVPVAREFAPSNAARFRPRGDDDADAGGSGGGGGGLLAFGNSAAGGAGSGIVRGGLALMGLSSVASMAGRGLSQAQEEAVATDHLQKALRDTGTDFQALRDRLRDTAGALHLTYGAANDLARIWTQTTNARTAAAADDGVRLSGGLARGFGIEATGVARGIGRAQFMGEDPRRFAEIWADTVARSQMTGRSEEVLGALTRFTETAARGLSSNPDVEAFARFYTALNRSGQPGLKGEGAENLLNRADQSLRQGGDAADPVRFLLFNALKREGVEDINEQNRILEGGMFERVRQTRRPDGSFEVDESSPRLIDVVLPEIYGVYGGTRERPPAHPEMAAREDVAVGKVLGLRQREANQFSRQYRSGEFHRAAPLLEGMRLTGPEAGQKLAEAFPQIAEVRREVDAGDREAVERRRAALLARKDVGEEDKRALERAAGAEPAAMGAVVAQTLARVGPEGNEGKRTADAAANISNALTAGMSAFVPAVNDFKEGVGRLVPVIRRLADAFEKQQGAPGRLAADLSPVPAIGAAVKAIGRVTGFVAGEGEAEAPVARRLREWRGDRAAPTTPAAPEAGMAERAATEARAAGRALGVLPAEGEDRSALDRGLRNWRRGAAPSAGAAQPRPVPALRRRRPPAGGVPSGAPSLATPTAEAASAPAVAPVAAAEAATAPVTPLPEPAAGEVPPGLPTVAPAPAAEDAAGPGERPAAPATLPAQPAPDHPATPDPELRHPPQPRPVPALPPQGARDPDDWTAREPLGAAAPPPVVEGAAAPPAPPEVLSTVPGMPAPERPPREPAALAVTDAAPVPPAPAPMAAPERAAATRPPTVAPVAPATSAPPSQGAPSPQSAEAAPRVPSVAAPTAPAAPPPVIAAAASAIVVPPRQGGVSPQSAETPLGVPGATAPAPAPAVQPAAPAPSLPSTITANAAGFIAPALVGAAAPAAGPAGAARGKAAEPARPGPKAAEVPSVAAPAPGAPLPAEDATGKPAPLDPAAAATATGDMTPTAPQPWNPARLSIATPPLHEMLPPLAGGAKSDAPDGGDVGQPAASAASAAGASVIPGSRLHGGRLGGGGAAIRSEPLPATVGVAEPTASTTDLAIAPAVAPLAAPPGAAPAAAPALVPAVAAGNGAERRADLSDAQRAIAPEGSMERGLMDLIGRAEGTDRRGPDGRAVPGTGYGTTYGHGRFDPVAGADITQMTIAELREFQRGMTRNSRAAGAIPSSAAGRYQMMRATLGDALEAGVVRADERFTPEVQDRLALWRMRYRGLDRFQRGEIGAGQAQNNLAHEWASLPTMAGGGAHQGQRAHVRGEAVQSVLAGRGPGAPPPGLSRWPQTEGEAPILASVPVEGGGASARPALPRGTGPAPRPIVPPRGGDGADIRVHPIARRRDTAPEAADVQGPPTFDADRWTRMQGARMPAPEALRALGAASPRAAGEWREGAEPVFGRPAPRPLPRALANPPVADPALIPERRVPPSVPLPAGPERLPPIAPVAPQAAISAPRDTPAWAALAPQWVAGMPESAVDPVLQRPPPNTAVPPTPAAGASPVPHGTPLPPGERDRQAASSGQPGQQQMTVAGAFSIQPLRVEHTNAATGEVTGVDYLPITAITPARPYGWYS